MGVHERITEGCGRYRGLMPTARTTKWNRRIPAGVCAVGQPERRRSLPRAFIVDLCRHPDTERTGSRFVMTRGRYLGSEGIARRYKGPSRKRPQPDLRAGAAGPGGGGCRAVISLRLTGALPARLRSSAPKIHPGTPGSDQRSTGDRIAPGHRIWRYRSKQPSGHRRRRSGLEDAAGRGAICPVGAVPS